MQVVIPIGTGSNWENNELRYCLRSLREALSDPVELIILGEVGVSIPWIKNALYFEVERYYPDSLEQEYGVKRYENFFATLGKYKWVCHQDWLEEEFLLVYDDIVFLNPVGDVHEFENVALCPDRLISKPHKRKDRHEATILQALELVNNYKKHDGTYNYETHAPRLYKKSLLQKLFRQNDITKLKIPFALSTLYGNIFYDIPKELAGNEGSRHICYNHWGNGFHELSATSTMVLDLAAKEYKVLSYQDKGLNAVDHLLARWIEDKFALKSCWEK